MKQKLFLTSSALDVPKDHAFNGIDVFKFICSILLCCNHIPPIQDNLWGLGRFNFYFQQFLPRTVAPFFFITSGFLLFRKMDPQNINMDKIKNFALRMVRLLGIWILLLFQGGVGHLWYLHSVIVAVFLVAFLLKKGVKIVPITAIALVLFIIGLFGDSYNGFLAPLLNFTPSKLLIVTFDNIIPNTRNGLFFGFVFVAMGAMYAHKRIVMPNAVALIGMFASLALLLYEVIRLHSSVDPRHYNLLLSQVPLEFFAFYVALHLNLKNRPIYKTLRIVGLLLYLGHLFVDHFVWVALSLVKKVTGLNVMSLELILTVVLTIALGYVIMKLSETPKGQWLKIIYT